MKEIRATVVFDYLTVFVNPFETYYDLPDDLEAYIEGDIMDKIYDIVPGITDKQKELIFKSVSDIDWEGRE